MLDQANFFRDHPFLKLWFATFAPIKRRNLVDVTVHKTKANKKKQIQQDSAQIEKSTLTSLEVTKNISTQLRYIVSIN